MKSLIFSLTEDHSIAESLARSSDFEAGKSEFRRFPDGESYVRVHSDCSGRDCAVFHSLAEPDAKIPGFLFMAETLREFGAERVGAVVPYLPYMRQDKRFQPGEGVTSRYFADWVSDTYDWLITVDPHIHRYDGLGDIYEIETAVCQAKRMVGEWVREKVKDPVILGPDSESKQWVGAVAGELDIPYTVLEKTRRGDRDVVVSVPDPELLEGRQPVILDDIISTGRTMIETIGHLNDFGTESPICVGIHGIFSGNTGEQLMEAGAKKVVTTNSIPHQTNEIDLTPVIRQGLSDYGFV